MSIHLAASDRVPWVEVGGLRVAAVLWGGLAILDAGRLAAFPSYAELGAVAVLVTAASVGVRTTTGFCAAVVGWLLVDGFVEHRYGMLGFDAVRDTGVLTLLVGLALLASRAHR